MNRVVKAVHDTLLLIWIFFGAIVFLGCLLLLKFACIFSQDCRDDYTQLFGDPYE